MSSPTQSVSASDIRQPLARNVRRWRSQRNLSISALARRSAVAKSTLSELERGIGNPGVDTVWAIANALDVPFAALFDDDGADENVRVIGLDSARVVVSENGAFITRHLLSRYQGGGFELYVLDLDSAGTIRRASAHSPGVVEHTISMSGRAEIGPEGQASEIGPGDCISFRADRPHHYLALDGPVRLLSVHEYLPAPSPSPRNARPDDEADPVGDR